MKATFVIKKVMNGFILSRNGGEEKMIAKEIKEISEILAHDLTFPMNDPDNDIKEIVIEIELTCKR